jgi:hypothetical protein
MKKMMITLKHEQYAKKWASFIILKEISFFEGFCYLKLEKLTQIIILELT